jgi:enediyne biosynthesis protein E4
MIMHVLFFGLPFVLSGVLGACSLSSAYAEPAPVIPRFVDETVSSGLASTFAGEWEFMVGGGVGSFDCDDNGLPDLLLAGGTSTASFFRNMSTKGGALRFKRAKSGLELDGVTGVYPLDVDGDGKRDLILLRVGENVIMRGLGQCQFARANEAWGFAGGDAWSTAFAATWEKGASWPTLAIGNYIDRKEEFSPWGSCTDNWLMRPSADKPGQFAPPVPLKPSHCALAMLFSDWNRSGTPSLRVSNDREYYEGGQEQLWRIEPGAEPYLFTDADGWKNLRIWGMGIASHDLDGDTYPEYFMTSMADNRLQSLVKQPLGPLRPIYSEGAFPKGITAHRPYTGGDERPSTAWHTQFEDVNNDGRVDLFIAKGNVSQMKDFAMKDPNNLLLQQADGTFIEAGDKAGIASFAVSRGGMLADYNGDGLLDLVVVNRNEPAQIWRNTSTDLGNWLHISLEQPGPNHDAIGSWIEIKAGERITRREITSGGGHVSGHLGAWHMGLGAAHEVELRILWPHGTIDSWQTVKANQFVIVKPGAKAVSKPPG